MTSTDAGSAAALGAAGWRNGSVRRTAPSGGRTRAERTRSALPSGLAAPEVARRVRDLPWDATPSASKRKRRYCPIDKPDSQRRGTGARTVRGSHRRHRRKSRAGEMTVGDGNASTDAGSAAALGAAGWRNGSVRRTAPSGGRTRAGRTRSAPPSGPAAPEVARRVRDLPWDAAPNASKRKRRYRPTDKPGSQRRGTGARSARGCQRRHRKNVGDGKDEHRRWKWAALGAAGCRNGSVQQTPVSPDR